MMLQALHAPDIHDANICYPSVLLRPRIPLYSALQND